MEDRFRNAVTCVPGVRIVVGSRGLSTTIGPGGSGFRPAAGGGRQLGMVGDPRLSGPLPTDRYLIPGTRTDYGTGDVTSMTSPGLASFKALLLATSQRKREIGVDIRKARGQVRMAWAGRVLSWVTLAAVLPPVRRAARNRLETRRTEVATLGANLDASAITVDFDMESAVGDPQRRLHEAFGRLMGCRGQWSISSSQRIDSVRARTTAASVVARKPASLGRGADPLVRTTEPPLAMPVQGGRSTAYFYPGFVLVAARDGRDFALIDLVDLNVDARTARFTETEGVPSDATIVGSTWAKSNKNGSRDRRFKNNRELPVASYGELTLSGPGGLNEAFMTSRVEPCREFVAAVRDLQRVLASDMGASKVAGKRAITTGR